MHAIRRAFAFARDGDGLAAFDGVDEFHFLLAGVDKRLGQLADAVLILDAQCDDGLGEGEREFRIFVRNAE